MKMMREKSLRKILDILNTAEISGDYAKAKRQLGAYEMQLNKELGKFDDGDWQVRRDVLKVLEQIRSAKKLI